MNFTIPPYQGWVDLRAWLLLVTLLCAVQTWMLWGKAFRREPPGLVWRTFLDDRGVPDSKQMAVFHALCVMTITMIVGWCLDRWPPYYVWISWDFIAIAGIFGTAYVTKKYYDNNGSTAPPEFGMGGMGRMGRMGGECDPGDDESDGQDDEGGDDKMKPAGAGPDSVP